MRFVRRRGCRQLQGVLSMKHFVFLEARGSADALGRQALEAFATPPFPAAVSVVLDGGAEESWHVVIEAWTDEHTLSTHLEAGGLPQVTSARAIYRVEELVEKDEGPGPGWPVEGVRLIVPWIGHSDVSPSERRRHWDEHVPLANRIHVGVTRYVRNWVEAAVGDDAVSAPPYQGIASQHYPSEHDLRERSFDLPASVQVIQDDVADFIAEHVVLRVVEYRHARQT